LSKIELDLEIIEDVDYDDNSFFEREFSEALPIPRKTTMRDDKVVEGHPGIRSPTYLGI